MTTPVNSPGSNRLIPGGWGSNVAVTLLGISKYSLDEVPNLPGKASYLLSLCNSGITRHSACLYQMWRLGIYLFIYLKPSTLLHIRQGRMTINPEARVE